MTTHKHTVNRQQTGAYKSWAEMKRRCLDPRRNVYRHYGGKGVKVCEAWMSFENFFSDMGHRPKGMSLDRMNKSASTKHYSCGKCRQCKRNGWAFHCRWATVSEQRINRQRFKNNNSGYTGVSYQSANKRWRAKFKNQYLGLFDTPEQAKKAYDAARRNC